MGGASREFWTELGICVPAIILTAYISRGRLIESWFVIVLVVEAMIVAVGALMIWQMDGVAKPQLRLLSRFEFFPGGKPFRRCEFCFWVNRAKVSFCTHCGHKLSSETPEPILEPRAQDPSSE